MRTAVLVKQVPKPAELTLVDGRLVRQGVPLETSAYCRRANARALGLAANPGDEVVVFTMGPPSAADSLKEMIACGASRGVLICDPLLAGSDTLITARVLAAAIDHEGPFDLVLTGAFSLDSETGHVGVQVAENLGLPFVGPCRALDIGAGALLGTVEYEGGFVDVEVLLPVVASAAERLCAPSKASPDRVHAVPDELIRQISADDLGFGPDEVGLHASPTWVGDRLRGVPEGERRRLRTTSVSEALDMLQELMRDPAVPARAEVPEPAPELGFAAAEGNSAVWYIADPTAPAPDSPLLAAVAARSATAARPLVAVLDELKRPTGRCATELLLVDGPTAPEDWVAALVDRLPVDAPHAVVIEGTGWGRELAARMAARLGWGLVGDAVDLTVEQGELLAWKSAFSGQAMVPIASRSPSLLVTVRPGAMSGDTDTLPPATVRVGTLHTSSHTRVIYDPPRDVDTDGRELSRASCVVAVGSGVPPEDYAVVDEFRVQLGAGPLGATRRVTDAGWLPRSRQIGLTGRSVAPELLVSIGASGKFNHTVGFRGASVVVAVNQDWTAPIFDQADIGIVGDWREIVTALTAALRSRNTMLADSVG